MSWRRTKRRWRRRWRRLRRLWAPLPVKIVAVVAVLAAVPIAAVLMRDPEPPPTIATMPESTSGLEPTPVDAYTPKLDDAMARLAERDRPFNILMIGDSTALDTVYGWHVLTMAWLAEQTDRPWTLQQWNANKDVTTVGYHEQPRSTTGSGALLTLWNATAGGVDFTYDVENIDKLLPPGVDIDLLIVNHGHNVAPERDYYTEGVPFLDRLHSGPLADAAMVMVAQNPERGDVTRIHSMARINDFVYTYSRSHALAVMDVYKAFEEKPAPERLVDRTTMRHPTHRGYRLWTSVAKGLFDPLLPD